MKRGPHDGPLLLFILKAAGFATTSTLNKIRRIVSRIAFCSGSGRSPETGLAL